MFGLRVQSRKMNSALAAKLDYSVTKHEKILITEQYTACPSTREQKTRAKYEKISTVDLYIAPPKLHDPKHNEISTTDKYIAQVSPVQHPRISMQDVTKRNDTAFYCRAPLLFSAAAQSCNSHSLVSYCTGSAISRDYVIMTSNFTLYLFGKKHFTLIEQSHNG